MRKLFYLFIVLLASCSKNTDKIDFGLYPADYEIAYFDNMGVNNIPSVRDLFGKNASFVSESFEMPATVNIETYTRTNNEFSVVMLLTVNNEKNDIETTLMRFSVKFEADTNTKMSYIRNVKVESLISGQSLESRSDGSEEQDVQTFIFFLNYMEMLWK